MKYFHLSYFVGLIFNCGNTQEFKNQLFFYVTINGQTPAFLAVASNVFPTVASRDILRNGI